MSERTEGTMPKITAVGLFVATVLIVSTGCGKPTADVAGTVTYADGSPIQGAVRTIEFVPTSDTTAEVVKSAKGQIGDDGSFQMYTRKPGDGVFKGDYSVVLRVLGDVMDPEGSNLIPLRYTMAGETPVPPVSVTGDVDDLKIEVAKE